MGPRQTFLSMPGTWHLFWSLLLLTVTVGVVVEHHTIAHDGLQDSSDDYLGHKIALIYFGKRIWKAKY